MASLRERAVWVHSSTFCAEKIVACSLSPELPALSFRCGTLVRTSSVFVLCNGQELLLSVFVLTEMSIGQQLSDKQVYEPRKEIAASIVRIA